MTRDTTPPNASPAKPDGHLGDTIHVAVGEGAVRRLSRRFCSK